MSWTNVCIIFEHFDLHLHRDMVICIYKGLFNARAFAYFYVYANEQSQMLHMCCMVHALFLDCIFGSFNSKVISLGGHGCKHVGIIVSREMENGALSEELRTQISLQEENAIALQQKQQKLKVDLLIIVKNDCYKFLNFFLEENPYHNEKVINMTCRRWNMQTKHKWI